MKNREWTYTDKSTWPRGEWDSEPDKAQWTDEATGLPCLVVRGPSGALCGYVGVAEGHPWFGKDYDDVDAECHGGLTFSNFCQPHEDNPERGICHIVDDEEDGHVWWVGFDCAHSGDLAPRHDFSFGNYDTYRNLAYVKRECARLAQQAEVPRGE